MKIKNYFASSSASDIRQNLDKWDSFTQVTPTSYSTQGQCVQQLSYAVTGAGTLTITQDTGSTTPSTSWLQAIAAGDILLLGGQYYRANGAATAASTTAVVLVPPPSLGNVTVTAATAFKVAEQGLSITAPVYAKTLDTLNISAHGIDIYANFPQKFFNAYTSYHYGGPNINTPLDRGLCFIPFCLYPGTYQPSGHINVSRAREFYINYTSSVISTNTEGTLVVIASAINFLLISDGSAVLRYST
jgi:hypothetical protein